MLALNRKLLRDLRQMWSQALTIALVVASGVAGFIASFSAYDALFWSRDSYYRQARFADVFATVKRAPQSLARELAALPGAAHVQTGLSQLVPVDLPGTSDPVIGRLIGIDAQHLPALNRIFLRSGRLPVAGGVELEVLVSEGFARARGLRAGDRLQTRLNGRRETLRITGIALSPEYIFAGLLGSPDLRGFGVFWLDHRTLAAAYDMQGAFNDVALRLAPGASAAELVDRLNRLLAPYGGISAHDRDEQVSHMIVSAEIDEQRVLGTVLPAIFLAVAAFLLNVVIGRLIATQREQIAALKALGYDNRVIAWHYLGLVLAVVLPGLALGVLLGAALGHGYMGLYEDVFRFPELRYRVRADLVLVAAALTLTAAVLGAWHTLAATVRMAPAEAMRPPAPGRYRPSLVEAWGLRERLGVAARMVLRTVQRRAWRTAMTVTGIAASMAIVISGTCWSDTIAHLLDTQFRLALRGDLSLRLVEAAPAGVVDELARLPHVTMVEGARVVPVRLVHGHRHWRGSLQGRETDAQLQRILDADLRARTPPAQGLLLTDRLAQRLQLRIGQTVRVELLEGRRQVFELPVVGTVTELMGLGAYIERHSLNRLLGEGSRLDTVTLAVERGHEDALLQALRQLPRVAVAFSKSVMLRNLESVTARNMLVFSTILTVFACIIAVGVVYNHARIALAERAWELASLRVLGFTRAEVSSVLLGELALEIALAIPPGLAAGYGLARLLTELLKNDEFYFQLVITPSTYAWAALVVVAAGAASAFVVRRRIDALDLVAVLKTRE